MSRMRKRFFDTTNLTLEEATQWGTEFAEIQRDIMFWLGDLARYAKRKWPERHHQVWPEFVSPGLIDRAAGVGNSYPREEERQHEATYSQFMQVAGKPDRQARLADIVERGLTTDESRAARNEERTETINPRWLIAFDTHYFAHRHYYSGAGVETAMQVAEWIQRTVERLKAKGASDVVCAFEGHGSFRKELTTGEAWADQRYKDRPPKPEDLRHQLILCRELVEKMGFCCVSVDEYEADDVLASYANQFHGRTTIVSSDKDLRSCLSSKCNMLLDVEWKQDEHSGDMLPEFKWLSAKSHTEATGIPPDKWVEYQCLRGDPTDGIRGCEGIGEKGAKDLVLMFGSAAGAVSAAVAGDERIKESKRKALIEFASKLDVTRKLVTLVDTLEIPTTTRLA